MKRQTLSLLCVWLLNFSAFAQAVVSDPNPEFKKFVSKNFEIVFEERHEELAKLFILSAEKARYILKPYYSQMPDKVTIVLSDITDLSNGAATFFPYPTIYVYPALPQEGSVLSNYKSWPDLLMLHEYVHSLQMHPAEGFYTPLKYIFGSIVRPNFLLPRWMLEGVATDFESRLTGIGRMNSTLYNARLRAMLIDGTLYAETLDRINETGIPSYPFGERPYFMGALLSHEVSELAGADVWGKLFVKYGRSIPYTFFNSRLSEYIGETYAELLKNAYKNYANLLKSQIGDYTSADYIKNKSLQKINAIGDLHHNPSVSPDGKWLVYSEQELKFGTSLRLVPRHENGDWDFNKSIRIKKITEPTQVSWLADSTRFLFEDVASYKRAYMVKDIYEFDMSKLQKKSNARKSIKRLTKGERSYSATYLNDRYNIAYIRSQMGMKNEIVLFEPKNKDTNTKVIFTSALEERASSLTYDQSENSLFFVLQNKNGEQSLNQLSLLNNEITKVSLMWNNKDLKHLGNFTLHGDNYWFLATITGAQNLFKSDRNFKNIVAVTNTVTHIDSYTILDEAKNDTSKPSTKIAIVSELKGSGNILTLHALTEQKPTVLEPLIKYKKNEVAQMPEIADKEIAKTDYSVWPYMIPHYWIPSFYAVEGGSMLQASTSSSDPMGRNSYALSVEHDTFSNRSGYSFMYNHSNRMRLLSMYSQVSNIPVSYTSDLVITNNAQGAQAGFYLNEDSNFRAYLGFVRAEIDYADIEIFNRQGPFYGVSYSSEDKYKDKNLKVNKYEFLFTHQNYLKHEGFTSYNNHTASFDMLWTEYLPKTHAIHWKVSGSFAADLNEDLINVFGETTLGGNYYQSLIQSPILMRGYPSAVFRGRNLINTNLEYAFDFSDDYFGLKHAPFFFKKTRVNLFLDALTLDGYYENTDLELVRTKDFAKSFIGYGFEFWFSMTIGYHFPFSTIVGLYNGVDREALGGLYPFIGISFGDNSSMYKESTH